MRATAACLLFVVAALGGCATEPEQPPGFDDSAGLVVVTVLGDGFVKTGERRIPVEAVVLELRQRTRAMPLEQRQRFVVRVLMTELQAGSPEAGRAGRDLERLLQELQIMGVKQARVL